ncbi:hypothetical protein GCM10007877_30540 [Marinibactrum halimedae]|uniref:histidine kinase n=2 Tax=Marinibactrum halimedae TaxID=1444977 RepID=A0AA37WNE9_9GAMM|nr:hypothetical protein GCM10007877_30540 [Marinibactrum halimedae]
MLSRKKRLSYTWSSTTLLLGVIAYLFIGTNPFLIPIELTPSFLWQWPLQTVVLICAGLLLTLDIRRFYRRQKRYIAHIEALQEQIQELTDHKKHLQSKAHTYSNQADKLKFFISDRLLEYIEYDEKFLHFRGIAAEVRHNGIICYDKVKQSLQNARDHFEIDSHSTKSTSPPPTSHHLHPEAPPQYEQQTLINGEMENTPSEGEFDEESAAQALEDTLIALSAEHRTQDNPPEESSENNSSHIHTTLNSTIPLYHHNPYAEAIISLDYLWDLLDLSTTENIALHINNHLCECEEYYYQAQLQKKNQQKKTLNNTTNGEEPLPYVPTFFAHNSVLRAIAPLMEDFTLLHNSDTHGGVIRNFHDSQFWFDLDAHCELLGNENHLVLVMENLVKNALYYSSKLPTGKNHSGSTISRKYHRVSIALTKQPTQTLLRVYNHGPHIRDEDADKLFQLGFTTRRAKGQHGKGLGLYFVREVIKGYEGNIEFQNIENTPESYSIRIELDSSGFSSGAIITDIVEVQVTKNGLRCNNQTSPINDNANLSTHTDEFENHHSNKNTPPSNNKTIEWKYKKPIKSVEITPRSQGQTHVFSHFETDTLIKITDPNNHHIPKWAIEITTKRRSSKLTFIPLDTTGVEFNVTLPNADAQFSYEDDLNQRQDDDEYLSFMETKLKPLDVE